LLVLAQVGRRAAGIRLDVLGRRESSRRVRRIGAGLSMISYFISIGNLPDRTMAVGAGAGHQLRGSGLSGM
jgi:hypothetical protein